MTDDLLHQLHDFVRSRRFGKYRGKVVRNDDQTLRGRLMVSVPAVLGAVELWAMPCVPYAGKSVGLFAMPPVDSGVWVEFEGGDPSFPIWTGCFWADGEAPVGGDPSRKALHTDHLKLTLDDGADEAMLETGSNTSLVMTDTIVAQAAAAKHTIAASGVTSELAGGKLEVKPGVVSINGGAWLVSG